MKAVVSSGDLAAFRCLPSATATAASCHLSADAEVVLITFFILQVCGWSEISNSNVRGAWMEEAQRDLPVRDWVEVKSHLQSKYHVKS